MDHIEGPLHILLVGKKCSPCGDNCYSIRSNNPQDWLDGWIILVPPSNDLLSPIIFQSHHIHCVNHLNSSQVC